ncbi:MAG: hypothetical protein JJU28_04910 [Cyclobacteriaceae bacterium]|nr:hypothetical protein [Cyclobacteriaceae bacterium]
MKTTKEKTLDAVKIQREIRKKISSETENMTHEELMKYIEQRIKKTGTKPIGQK